MARTPKEERISKGISAKTLIEDPILQEVFEKLETSYNNAWISSGLDDVQKRETLYLSIRALSQFKLELESMIMGGKIAQKE
jgi:hypothetical protein|tara:strand:+ start:1579 stop:1824 length:246 start_codon:yes stop_codon:yes gene_type:complete